MHVQSWSCHVSFAAMTLPSVAWHSELVKSSTAFCSAKVEHIGIGVFVGVDAGVGAGVTVGVLEGVTVGVGVGVGVLQGVTMQ